MSTEHDPIAILNHEHIYIKKVIGALTLIASSADTVQHADPALLRKTVLFMREFADKCHHAKEEAILFPKMEEKGVPEAGCPLGALRNEHEQGRQLVKSLSDAIDQLENGAPDAGRLLKDTIDQISELYTSHIWKEDEMVFPMVDRLFSDLERNELFELFEKAEEEIGADHEKLAAFAEELESQVNSN